MNHVSTPSRMMYKKRSVLRGPELVLEQTTVDHAEGLYEQIQSDGVLQNLTIEVENLEEFRKYTHFIQNQWKLNQDFTYTIFSHQHLIIGQISLYNISFAHRRGEIGLWLGHSYWHQGFGKKAMDLVIQYSFHDLNLNRIQAHIFTSNQDSILLFEYLGFQREGIIRQYVLKEDTYRDVYSYSLLRGDLH